MVKVSAVAMPPSVTDMLEVSLVVTWRWELVFQEVFQ